MVPAGCFSSQLPWRAKEMFFGLLLSRYFSSCCLGCVCVRGAELPILVHQQAVHEARVVLGLQVVAWPCPGLCNAR